MELELDLGFRSSFNFIPEGSYRVPAELREELTAKDSRLGYTILNTMVISFPRIAGSNDAP